MSDSLRPHRLQHRKPGFSVLHHLLEFPQTHVHWGFPGDSAGKESTCNTEDLSSIPGLGRSPGEGKATHSNILAWRIPWTAYSMELQRVGATFSFTFMSTELVMPSNHLIRCCSFLLLPSIFPSIRV